jgi:hypothetical protein
LTRPDNVFASLALQEAIIKCNTCPEDQPARTDHFPIDTVLAIQTQRAAEIPRCNFRDVEWEKFRERLEEKIDKEVPSTPIQTAADLIDRTGCLTKSITDTIEERIPLARPSPYTKQWWTREIAEMR